MLGKSPTCAALNPEVRHWSSRIFWSVPFCDTEKHPCLPQPRGLEGERAVLVSPSRPYALQGLFKVGPSYNLLRVSVLPCRLHCSKTGSETANDQRGHSVHKCCQAPACAHDYCLQAAIPLRKEKGKEKEESRRSNALNFNRGRREGFSA